MMRSSLLLRVCVAACRPHLLSLGTHSARLVLQRTVQKSAAGRRFFASSPQPVQVVKIPQLGESIVDGTVASIMKNVGDYVNQDDIICVLETAKVSCDVRSPYAGRLESLAVKVGDTIAVDAELARIDTTAKQAQPTQAHDQPTAPPQQAATQPAPPPQQPAAQPSPASRPAVHAWNGRRAKTPEEAATITPAAQPVQPAKPAVPAPAQTVAVSPATLTGGATRGERRVKMTRLRQTIAERLKHAQNTLALLTTFNEIDMHNLMEMRDKLKTDFSEKHKVKLGFMSAFVKASTAALQAFPDVNACIDGNHIVYHDYVDISVAVASPNGLVVPVLRNTERMSFADVEKAIGIYGEKAKKKQLVIEEMTGGTFTISNGGVFGSVMGTPIVNPPQSAILGMHGIFRRPVVGPGDKIIIRPIMNVALTYDHRLIDGATAVQFLRRIKSLVEEPSRLLLDL